MGKALRDGERNNTPTEAKQLSSEAVFSQGSGQVAGNLPVTAAIIRRMRHVFQLLAACQVTTAIIKRIRHVFSGHVVIGLHCVGCPMTP